jgi:2-(1,2-epoxy-1,2-dihydrophenyl)acetyl-CoA isomerase
MGYERISLNHPEVLTAMGSQMVEEFSLALLEVGDPANGARCLLLTGEGRAFCSGANLTDEGPAGRTGGARTTLRRNYHPLLCGLRDLEMPMVTAVHGPAAGVGMSFALMADIVCASKEGYFLQAFARIGLVPDGGATFLLPRLIGWGRAVELSMLAEKLPAERAHEWGLVNRLYEDREALMEGASEMAQRLARGPRSLALIRRAYWATWQNSYEQQLDLEARSQGEASATEDAKEGRDSFLEKREARFQGR